MKLIEGKTYDLAIKKDGGVIRATVDSIRRYPATGMPPDYMMKNIEGGEDLVASYERGLLDFLVRVILPSVEEEKKQEVQDDFLHRLAEKQGFFSLPDDIIRKAFKLGLITEIQNVEA